MKYHRVQQIIRKQLAIIGYPVVETYLRVKFLFVRFKKRPIVVLTPGKVGSSSVYYSLKNANLKRKIYHIHNINPETIKKSIKINKEKRGYVPLHLIYSKIAAKALVQTNPYIISLVREPIAREISSLFQNLDMFHGLTNRSLDINRDTLESILFKFRDLSFLESYSNWFKTEIEHIFEIDLFSEQKDKKDKFFCKRNRKCQLLFMRMEDLDDAFNEGLKQLSFDKMDVHLKKRNIGQDKFYSKFYHDYKESLNSLKIKTQYRENKIVKTFYADY